MCAPPRALCAPYAMQVNPSVSQGQAVESCYQIDIGREGDIPGNRRIWYKTGMSSTTLDLFNGTTKETYQVREFELVDG